MKGSPSFGSFSFPKLNGSPSRCVPPSPLKMMPLIYDNRRRNFTRSHDAFQEQSGHAPHLANGGFFNASGFNTPVDTVLDRFGRTGPMLAPPQMQPHGQRKLPSLASFGRSNSLGRNLPPIPSKPPTLVRRRTFEDDDYRTDWI